MIRLSANSLKYLLSCERKYYNIYQVERNSLREFSWPLEFGSAVHDVMGVYDHWRFAEGKTPAVHHAVARAVEISADWDEWRETTLYNSWTLARIPVWYAEHFGADDVVEAVPSPPDVSWTEYPWEYEYRGVMLNGYLDNVVNVFGENLILDRKTTSRTIDGDYIQGYSPDIQFTLYPWVMKRLFPHLEISAMLCEGIQLQVGAVDFDRFIVRRSQDELDEFEDMLNRAIDRRLALENQPERSWIQNQAVCYSCPFRRLCAASIPERERIRNL